MVLEIIRAILEGAEDAFAQVVLLAALISLLGLLAKLVF